MATSPIHFASISGVTSSANTAATDPAIERLQIPVAAAASRAYRSARSSCRRLIKRLISSSEPTGRSSRSSRGTVSTRSQLITQVSGSPSAGPISTSNLIPRIVRVIGAQVTASRTEIAASRVRTQTGRRPAGSPRSAQKMSFLATTLARRVNRFSSCDRWANGDDKGMLSRAWSGNGE